MAHARKIPKLSFTPQAVEPCKISHNCWDLTRPTATESPLTLCNEGDLSCICMRTSDLGPNVKLYDCVFDKCTNTEAREGFMNDLIKACTDGEHTLLYVPQKWRQFMPPLSPFASSIMWDIVSRSTQATLSTVTTTTSPTSTAVATTMMQASVTSDRKEAIDPTAAPSQRSLVQMQMPICGITLNSRVNKDTTDACDLDDLRCICKIDNSLSINKYFYPNQLHQDCYSNLARREWLEKFAYSCKAINNPLVNITGIWQPYLPDWYLKALPTSGSPSPSSANTSNSPTSSSSFSSSPPSSPTLPPLAAPNLSTGAKAGIAVGSFLLISGLVILLIAFLRARKKSKNQTRQVAVLHDQMNDQGMSQRINTIINGEDSDFDTSRVVLPTALPKNDGMSQATTRITQTPYPPVPPKNEGPDNGRYSRSVSSSQVSTRVASPPPPLHQREFMPTGHTGDRRDSSLVYPSSGYESRPGISWVEEYDAKSTYRPKPLNGAKRDRTSEPGGYGAVPKDTYR